MSDPMQQCMIPGCHNLIVPGNQHCVKHGGVVNFECPVCQSSGISSQRKFSDVLSALLEQRCETCQGSGECDDADLGDIYYNTWQCSVCKGSGFKP